MNDHSEYVKRIGSRIKHYRTDRGLTMKELGQKIGVSESAVSKYESGSVREISINTIKKIASVLDCPAESIMAWDSKSEPGWIADNSYIIEKLSPENQAHLIEYAKFLLSKQDS